MPPVQALPVNWNHIEEIQEALSCKASHGFLWQPTAEFNHQLMNIELKKIEKKKKREIYNRPPVFFFFLKRK